MVFGQMPMCERLGLQLISQLGNGRTFKGCGLVGSLRLLGVGPQKDLWETCPSLSLCFPASMRAALLYHMFPALMD